MSLLLGFLWAGTPGTGDAVFPFAAGAVLLSRAVVVKGHPENLIILHWARRTQAVTGTVTASRRFAPAVSGADALTFGGLFLFVFLVTGSWFVLGGAVSCVVLAGRVLLWGRTDRRSGRDGTSDAHGSS